MAALTADTAINMKGTSQLFAFPVASGETIYKGTFAVVDNDGYLRNLSSTYAPEARIVVFVSDETANVTGPAATTSAGSISGSLEQSSSKAGDKTVRLCYMHGTFKGTFTSITQADVGKTVYATNNNDIDETQAGGVKIGTLITYISATVGYFRLNEFNNADGTVFYKQALVASSGGGGLFNIANPAGDIIMIERLAIDIATATTTALTIDAGIAATGTTDDSLIDGVTSSIAGVFDNITDAGTNGGATVKCSSSLFITGTISGAAAATALAGTVGIWYRVWE